MCEKTFQKLLQYGIDKSELEQIKSKHIVWDIIEGKLSLWDSDGACRFICDLSEQEIDELLNLYRFEEREKNLFKSTEIFEQGEFDDWAGVSPKSDWKKYVDGYVKSAEILGSTIPNDFIEPYLFMCRHSLELSLKSILMLGQELYDLSPDLPGHHDLRKLWTSTYPILKLLNKCEDSELEFIGKFVEEYHIIDEQSFSFRYPVSKKNISIKHENYLTAFKLSTHRNAYSKVTRIIEKVFRGIQMKKMMKNFNKWRAEQTLPGDN